MSEKDGGPAFGGAYDDVLFDESGRLPAQKLERRVSGMALRDYFAEQALVGIIASYTGGDLPLPDPAYTAERMREYADAWLSERTK